jgi:hypothetical protein
MIPCHDANSDSTSDMMQSFAVWISQLGSGPPLFFFFFYSVAPNSRKAVTVGGASASAGGAVVGRELQLEGLPSVRVLLPGGLTQKRRRRIRNRNQIGPDLQVTVLVGEDGTVREYYAERHDDDLYDSRAVCACVST